MASARPGGLLNETLRYFTEHGWSETDLATFRMQEGDDDEDDLDDDKPDDKPKISDDDIEKMKAALKKANKEAEQTRLKLKEKEDRDKSETEKLTERTRELESNLTTAEKTALRYEIALDKGVPKSIASRLQGDTREEMEKDADELLQTIGTTSKKPPSFDGGAKDTGHEGGGSFLAKALRDKRAG